MGYSGEQFDPDRVDLYIESAADGRLQLVANGAGTDFSEELALRRLLLPSLLRLPRRPGFFNHPYLFSASRAFFCLPPRPTNGNPR